MIFRESFGSGSHFPLCEFAASSSGECTIVGGDRRDFLVVELLGNHPHSVRTVFAETLLRHLQGEGAFARAQKTPAARPGFKFARKELYRFEISIWRRPEAER